MSGLPGVLEMPVRLKSSSSEMAMSQCVPAATVMGLTQQHGVRVSERSILGRHLALDGLPRRASGYASLRPNEPNEAVEACRLLDC